MKDLNQQFALEQLREKCKSYQQYRIETYGDSNQIEYMDYDLSDKTIEYLVFGIRDAIPDQFAVYLNFTNKSYTQGLLEHLNEARKAIESRELVDKLSCELLEHALEYATESLELDDDSSLLFTCDTIVNFDEDDLSKVQVVSIPMEFVDSEFEEFVDELHCHLVRLKEALESALSASQELNEPQLTNTLSKAFTTDLQNGNNNEKLRIINKVSSAIDEIEQIVKQLNSAYRDMLVHLYGDEAES